MDKSTKARIARVQRAYGWTPKQWENCFNMQGRKCAVCKSPEPRSTKGWHVDHDHGNGRIRGILCHHCNVALGMIEDDPERARQLISYLGRTAAWHARTDAEPTLLQS